MRENIHMRLTTTKISGIIHFGHIEVLVVVVTWNEGVSFLLVFGSFLLYISRNDDKRLRYQLSKTRTIRHTFLKKQNCMQHRLLGGVIKPLLEHVRSWYIQIEINCTCWNESIRTVEDKSIEIDHSIHYHLFWLLPQEKYDATQFMMADHI